MSSRYPSYVELRNMNQEEVEVWKGHLLNEASSVLEFDVSELSAIEVADFHGSALSAHLESALRRVEHVIWENYNNML